jgi:hypothetical protein
MMIDQHCEECGEVTVWYLVLASREPGVTGQTTWRWQCSGQIREQPAGE